MGFKEEILKRRTFGIISHPDAGKTTLTEKLLLFGGAIHELFVIPRDDGLLLLTDRLDARVRVGKLDSAQAIENLHDLFLVDHHAVGFGEHVLH